MSPVERHLPRGLSSILTFRKDERAVLGRANPLREYEFDVRSRRWEKAEDMEDLGI